MIRVRPALLLAVAATGTAISMSVLAGWRRGGWLAERLVWVAVGVVLVVCAHLVPALCRSAPAAVRGVSAVLWLGCMGAASFGHATFFLLSQFHAGEVRAATVPAVSVPAHRDLAAVMADRASVTTKLAQADARHCVRDCPALRVLRASLAARLDALDAEADEVRRYQVVENDNEARRVAARDDPVTARLAMIGGVTDTRLDLFAGLAFAVVLEGVACLLWWIAMTSPEPAPSGAGRHEAVSGIGAAIPVTTAPPAVPAVTLPDTEIARLQRDIESGAVRPTVTSIRRHLRCSQTKAMALRRQLAELAA